MDCERCKYAFTCMALQSKDCFNKGEKLKDNKEEILDVLLERCEGNYHLDISREELESAVKTIVDMVKCCGNCDRERIVYSENECPYLGDCSTRSSDSEVDYWQLSKGAKSSI